MIVSYRNGNMRGKVLLAVPWYVSGFHNLLDKKGNLKKMELGVVEVSNYVLDMATKLKRSLNGKECSVLIVDDGSPNGVPEQLILGLNSLKFEGGIFLLDLEKNVGFGHAVNIIQNIAVAGGFDYLIRWDTDVWPKGDFSGILDIFEKNSGTTLVTFKNPATWYLFCLNDESCRSGDHLRYLPVRSMIGNILIYKTDLFRIVGFDDPLLRGYSDVELQYRSDWAGFYTLMDTQNVVESLPSGANAIGDLSAQEAQLKYLVHVNTALSYSKSNNRLVLRGKRHPGAAYRFVPPSPLAIQSCMLLGLNSELLPFRRTGLGLM